MASTVCRCSSSDATRTASNCRLIAADPAPAVSATTRAMSRARSSAAAERFIQQAGEARQPLIEVGGAQVDGGDQRFQRGLALGDRGGGRAVGLLDHGGGLDQRAAMGVELGGERAEVLAAPSQSCH